MNIRAQISYKMIAVFAVFLCFLLVIVPIMTKDCFSLSQGDRSLVFSQIINYTIPTVKVISFDEEDLVESHFSMNNLLKNFMGIDFSSPFSILNKEMPSLGLTNDTVNNGNGSLSSNQFVEIGRAHV